MTPPRTYYDLLREAVGYGQAVATEAEWSAAIRDAFDPRPCEALSSRDPGHVATPPIRSPPAHRHPDGLDYFGD